MMCLSSSLKRDLSDINLCIGCMAIINESDFNSSLKIIIVSVGGSKKEEF